MGLFLPNVYLFQYKLTYRLDSVLDLKYSKKCVVTFICTHDLIIVS